MDEKKEYKTMLKVLSATTNYSTMLTKLSDISVMTEDATLKAHAQGLHAALRVLLGPVVQSGNIKNSLVELGRNWHGSQLPKQSNVSKNVIATYHYCQQCISASEPQWMLLARNAGWIPPSNNP